MSEQPSSRPPSLVLCRRCDAPIGLYSANRTHLEIAAGVRVSGRVPGTRIDLLCRCGQRRSFTDVMFGYVAEPEESTAA